MPIKIAVVLRYKDDLLDDGLTTVEEHNKIFTKKGKVWFGKFGLPINNTTLRLSTEPDVEAYLILVRAKRSHKDTDPKLFIARCLVAQNKTPRLELIPSYYRKHTELSTWFCLTSKIQPLKISEAQTWIIASSGDALLRAVQKCPRTFFLVTKKCDAKQLQTILPSLHCKDEQHKGRTPKRAVRPFADNDDSYEEAGDTFNNAQY